MTIRLCICILFMPLVSMAQWPFPPKSSTGGAVLKAVIIDGDTVPIINLTKVDCIANRIFKNKRQEARWTRLLHNVKVVYPYAILAAARLKEYDLVLAKLPNDGARKKYMGTVEEKLKAEFEEDLKNLTITQGKILVKLIDRETGKNSYTLIKELRGSFSAFMWQSLAVLFSSNLKTEYDAEGDDRAIEEAIRLIEGGYF